MAGELVAVRMVEDVEDGAGGIARYALYAAAIVAALAGAWVLAGPSSKPVPAPDALSVRTSEMPVGNVRQIDMTPSATPTAASNAPAAYTAPAAPAEAAPPVSETAAVDPEPIPPKPIPRPAHVAETTASIEAAPVAAAVEARPVAVPAVQPVAPASPAAETYVQRGAPPSNLGVLREPANRYVAPQPVYAPAQPAATYQPAGPVPPMPIEGQVEDMAPAGEPLHHQGLLGATERTLTGVWDWTTGTANNVVRGVQQGF